MASRLACCSSLTLSEDNVKDYFKFKQKKKRSEKGRECASIIIWFWHLLQVKDIFVSSTLFKADDRHDNLLGPDRFKISLRKHPDTECAL